MLDRIRQPTETTLKKPSEEEKLDRYIDRLGKRGQRYLGSVALLSFVVLPAAYYTSDVVHNHSVAANAEIEINKRYESLSEANSDTGIVIMNGFGTQHADHIAKYQGEALQSITDGSLYSVNYQNAPLDHENIAKQIIDTAKQDDLDRVSVVGYSAGGNTSADVALYIIENSDLDVPAIIFNLTPDGLEGLHPDQRGNLDLLDAVTAIPGAKYSKHVRFIAEAIMRVQQNPDKNAWQVIGQAHEAVYQEKIPGFSLMIDQAMSITDSSIESSLSRIGEVTKERGKLKPVVIYLSGEPGADHLVDNQYSSQNICTYAKAAGLDCIVIEIPNVVHNYPTVSGDDYLESIQQNYDQINAALESAQLER